MKKLLLGLSFIVFFSLNAQSQFHFGAGAQLIFDGSVFGAQGKALYEINETYRGVGTFTWHLDDSIDWTIDLDAQYKLLEISDNFNISPLAGLAIINLPADTDIGINLGAFFDFIVGDDKHVYVEPKFIISGSSSLAVSAGIMF